MKRRAFRPKNVDLLKLNVFFINRVSNKNSCANIELIKQLFQIALTKMESVKANRICSYEQLPKKQKIQKSPEYNRRN